MLNMSAAQINCLLAIRELYERGPVASKEIAVQLHVSRPSVHRLLDALAQKGLVQKEPYGAVHLTDGGKERADELRGILQGLTQRLSAALQLSGNALETGSLALMSSLSEEELLSCIHGSALPSQP